MVVRLALGLSMGGAVACSSAQTPAAAPELTATTGAPDPDARPTQGSQTSPAPAPGSGAGERTGEAAVPVDGVKSLAESGLSRGTDTPADQLLKQGDDALLEGRAEDARRAFERAARLEPQDPAPLVGIARSHMDELPGAYASVTDEALAQPIADALERAQALDATFLPARLERGRFLLVTGDATGALRVFEQLLPEIPRDPEAHSGLGVALLATGDVDRALVEFRKAAELDPGDAERQANLGTAYMMTGNVSSAIRAYEQSLRIDDDQARVHSDLGTAYVTQGRYDAAMSHLQRAVALEPERATFLSNLAYAHLAAGQTQRAELAAQRATSLDPKLGSAWINLGTAQARRGSLESAERSLRRALELDPSDPRARANLDEVLALQQEAPVNSRAP